MSFPLLNEYAPFFQTYMNQVSEGNLEKMLQENMQVVADFFTNISTQKHDYKYAENKWTIKEMLKHIIDTERIFSYRALVGLRKDEHVVVYAFDENAYALQANTSLQNRHMESLVEEFLIVRKSLILLFKNVKPDALTFRAHYASGHPMTARAIGYITIGHARHHLNILQERYLK